MMSFISRIKHFFARTGETDPAKAYDLWAAGYDAQPHNLVLALDGEIFTGLLENVDLAGKTLADIGCGTGRHWPLLFSRSPKDLYGFDVSAGMLEKLKEKFPQARTCLLVAHRLETIEWVDQILVLQGGRIAERGTHQELMERNGLYAEMQRAQQQSNA